MDSESMKKAYAEAASKARPGEDAHALGCRGVWLAATEAESRRFVLASELVNREASQFAARAARAEAERDEWKARAEAVERSALALAAIHSVVADLHERDGSIATVPTEPEALAVETVRLIGNLERSYREAARECDEWKAKAEASEAEARRLMEALSGLVVALPRCYSCDAPHTSRFDDGYRTCDECARGADPEAGDTHDERYAAPLRRAVALLKGGGK